MRNKTEICEISELKFSLKLLQSKYENICKTTEAITIKNQALNDNNEGLKSSIFILQAEKEIENTNIVRTSENVMIALENNILREKINMMEEE